MRETASAADPLRGGGEARTPAAITAATWTAALDKGCELDSWGQPVEAAEAYGRLRRDIEAAVERGRGEEEGGGDDRWVVGEKEERILRKICLCLDLRCQILRSNDAADAAAAESGVTIDAMRRLGPWLRRAVEGDAGDEKAATFPVELTVFQQQRQILLANSSTFDVGIGRTTTTTEDSIEDAAKDRQGSLLPAPIMEKGKTYVSFKIEKIGVKDAGDLIDPYITVSVKNLSGADLTMPQSTPVAAKKESSYVHFSSSSSSSSSVVVNIQKPMEYLPFGFAVFFELHHYKPSKKRTSCKCFAFLEKDEIVGGGNGGGGEGSTVALELYKKPVDPKRKRLKLLTTKELYLHLQISLTVE